MTEGALTLGYNHDARGEAVKPVYNSRACGVGAVAGEFAGRAVEIGAMKEDGVHERARIVAGRGMYDESRLFVEND